jgi:hypothetical protein
MSSSSVTSLASMKTLISPTSVKSVMVVNRVTLARRSSPSRAIAAAAMVSRMPPRQ